MKNRIKFFVLIIIGSLAGYLYYLFVGCKSACLITSNLYTSVLYGAFLGFAFYLSFFTRENKKSE